MIRDNASPCVCCFSVCLKFCYFLCSPLLFLVVLVCVSKLLGLELFLNRYPEWRGKVTLIQVRQPVTSLVDGPRIVIRAASPGEFISTVASILH